MTTRITTAHSLAARTARATAALTALLLLGACGGDDGAAGAPATTAGSAGTSATTPSSPTADGATTSSTGTSSTGTETPTTAAPGADARDPEAELEVEDQRGDGTSVEVDEVRLSVGDGWVVITGSDGAALGSAAVPRSDDEAPLTVPLDTAVTGEAETRLVATLHLDDGDGVLDPALDPVVVDEDREDDGSAVDEDDLVRDAFDYRAG